MTNIITPQPLKLLKNRRFPTYQLYATVSNTKTDAEKALLIIVLETMSWLRKRFREFEIPNEIKFPEPDEYKNSSLDDFKSFNINDGYSVEVIFIRKKGIWSLRLIEPDLGPDPGNEKQKRQPVPGRIIETNIAYKIHNGKLECGFKTICSEPIVNCVPCEVFRLAVVKTIINNKYLGLEQILPFSPKAHEINSNEKISSIVDYIRNSHRQVPFVLIAGRCKKIDIKNIKVECKTPSINISNFIMRGMPPELAITKDSVDLDDNFQHKLNVTIKHRMGYAQFGFLPNKYIDYFNVNNDSCKLSSGDICIFYPEQFNTPVRKFKHEYIASNEDRFLKDLEDEMQDYPKFKNISYGNVKFLDDSRIEESNYIIEISNNKEEIISTYMKQISSVELKYKSEKSSLYEEIAEKDKKIDRQKEHIKSLELKNDECMQKIEENIKEYNIKIEKLQREIIRKDILLDRPKKLQDICQWVDDNFSDRLILHDRAKDLIAKTPVENIDLNLLCDSIEFLAYEYLDERLGRIGLEEKNISCSEKYNRSFDVTPSGGMNIRNYSKDYKVKYGIGYTGKPVEVPLDLHLKVGNTAKNLLRIYFFFDNDKKIIVIGSLPEHLGTMTEKS